MNENKNQHESAPAGAIQTQNDPVSCCGFASQLGGTGNTENIGQSSSLAATQPDADQFSFDPTTRRLTNETQGKTYDPIPLTPKEDEIRRSGGIFGADERLDRRGAGRRVADGPGPIQLRHVVGINEILKNRPHELVDTPLFDEGQKARVRG